MNLRELLAPWYDLSPHANIAEISIGGLKLDNRNIAPGDVFIALQGHSQDARCFIPQAISAGAVAVIADCGDKDGIESGRLFGIEMHSDIGNTRASVPVISFACLKSHLSSIADRFYHGPSEKMTMIGVTGTNGKTTVSQLIAQWIDLVSEPLDLNGEKAAVMGTTGNGFISALKPALNTTGNPIEIQSELDEFHRAGATHVALEVSSHGLAQNRVSAVNFDAVIFTNLSRDHLDYHKTMQDYAKAKQGLFTDYGAPIMVINADDSVGRQWLKEMPNAIAVSMSKSVKQEDKPYIHGGKKLSLTNVEYSTKGVEFAFSSDWGDGKLSAPLVGEFNVMNLLLSIATLLALGFDKKSLLNCAPKLKPVIGRMEVFHRVGVPMFIVDYAHTPDALEKALQALRRHCTGQLWCIFGCGGDRDAGKRPMMAAIAENLSDKVILTDDNPRSETPDSIVSQMLKGMKHPQNAIVLHDRAQACRYAFEHASKNDVILVAGKGHEDYQVLASETLHYSDRETVRHLLEEKAC